MKSATLKFYLGGSLIPAPTEWDDIEISASFKDDAVQANMSIDRFTFVNEARAIVKSWVADGMLGGPGVFEGPAFRIEASADAGTVSVFDGYLDLTEMIDFPERGRLDCGIKKKDGTGSIEDRLAAVTYAYLYEQGFIVDTDFQDVRYVVMKPIESVELATTAIMVFLLSKTLAEQVEKTSKDIATASAILVAGATGSIGAAVYAVAVVAIDIVYAVALLSALLKIGQEIINAFIPIGRTHKGIPLKKLIASAAAYAGYGFETDIEDLDHLIYLPSNIAVDKPDAAGFLGIPGRIQKGIPNSGDYGYTVAEIFALCKNLFNAKFAVLGGTLQLRSRNSAFWVRSASYTLPDVLAGSESFNTSEMFASRIIAFETDITDTWTIDNFAGTNYEIITTPITENDKKSVSIRGLEEIRFPVCLGNRKDELTALEKVLKGFAVAIDALTGVFGGGSNFANRIAASVNILKVSDNNHSKPKLLWFQGDSMPANARNLFSAKSLWEKYHIEKSFVAGDGYGQKYVYENARIPFGLEGFVALSENSYIATTKGQAKVTSVSWKLAADYAVVSYWIRKRYTANLKETFIEPE
jgi:hypothetical protein